MGCACCCLGVKALQRQKRWGYSEGLSVEPVKQCRCPAMVLVNRLAQMRTTSSVSVRAGTGCRHSAVLFGWRLPELQRDQCCSSTGM